MPHRFLCRLSTSRVQGSGPPEIIGIPEDASGQKGIVTQKPLVTKRQRALLELLSSERSYASDAHVRDLFLHLVSLCGDLFYFSWYFADWDGQRNASIKRVCINCTCGRHAFIGFSFLFEL